MRLIDKYVGIDIGRVHPIAAEILWQSATRFNHFRLNGRDTHSLRRLFGRLQCIAFGRNRHTNVQIVITILQEATVLFIFTTFLCVRHREIMIFADEPIAKATEFNDTGKCARHALTLFVCDVELLIGDQELRSGRLTRTNLGVWIVAFTSKSETILCDKTQIKCLAHLNGSIKCKSSC